MGFFLLTGYGFLRAFKCAQMAAIAGFFIDLVMEKGFAHPCRAFLVFNMGLVLITEIAYGCEHRVGGRGPQAA